LAHTSPQGNQVRICIDAPRDTPVYREEIYRQIQREQGSDYKSTDEPERVYGSFPEKESWNNKGNR